MPVLVCSELLTTLIFAQTWQLRTKLASDDTYTTLIVEALT